MGNHCIPGALAGTGDLVLVIVLVGQPSVEVLLFVEVPHCFGLYYAGA